MKALVTGGAGFIGSNLATTLESKGHDVTILDNFSSGNYRNLVDFHGNVIIGDVTEQEALEKAKDVDIIFHEASITDTTITDDRIMLGQNLEGFRNVLNFAAARRIKVVFASSAGIYGKAKKVPYKEAGEYVPHNVYAYSKLAMERLARIFSAQHSIQIIALRYFNVYGPREYYKGKASSMIYQLYLQMKSGRRPRIFKFGEQERDQVYVKDIVDGTILAAKSDIDGFDVFNLGSGQATSFNRIVETLQKCMKSSLQADYFDNPYPDYQNKTLADLSKAKKGLGYQPTYDIRKGAAEFIKTMEGEL